jgi:MoaA/NifB/PqqE/SkfB family radical SAM enzyme
MKDIQRIQIELSNVCNSQCPGCGRYERDWEKLDEVIKRDNRLDIFNAPLKLKESIDFKNQIHLDINVLKNLLRSESLSNLKHLELIGTIDDPFAYKHLMELFEFAAEEYPHLQLLLHTNGSLRTPDFFAKLPAIFNKFDSTPWVAFSIDGLEDTNHIYRRNCQWNKIMENAQAFIDAGGVARWQYLLFPWNEHQVQEAEELSKQMGFYSFKFRKDTSELTNLVNNHWPKVTWENWKNRPKRNNVFLVDPEQEPVEPNDVISCSYQSINACVIEHTGAVWPCCYFTSSRARRTTQEHHNAPFIKYGENWNNLNYHSFDDIMNHRFYTEDLVDSWSSNKHGYGFKDRIYRCTHTCKKSLGTSMTNNNNHLKEVKLK